MGMVHQIRVIARVPPGPEGTYRAIDALSIPSDDPGPEKLTIASQALSFFQANQDLIDLELQRAETLPDVEWSREEDEENSVPQFPVVRMCLLLAALAHDKHWFMFRLRFEPWNAVPDNGGKWMWETGCTFLNLTDSSVAFVLPSHKACGRARKSTYNRLKLRPLCGEQYLAAFGIEDQYRGPVRAEGNARAASIMPLETIQKVWPSFPPIYEEWKEDDEEEEEGGRRYLAGLYDSCDKIFRDETQHTDTDTKTNSEERCVSMEGQERKLAKIQDLLSNYTKAKLSSHKFDEDFPTLVHNFIRANAESFTPTMPGTVPLLLAGHDYQPWKLCYVSRIDLSCYPGLPADTVVELVRAVVDGNRLFMTKKRKRDAKEPLQPLELLDVSFNRGVTPKHLASILDMTRLDELRFWDNPGLADAVWDGRIAKLSSRERFLEPLQRLAALVDDWPSRRGTPRIQPPPPMAPTPARIRQLVWTTLKTTETDKPPAAVADWMQLPPPGKVSLAQLDADKLAWILHPRFRDWVEGAGEEACIFAETIAFPLHDVRAPRDEVYTSVARFKKSMTTEAIVRFGHDGVLNRWPLKLPLEMATGWERNRYAITSPFPAELFALAWDESLGNSWIQEGMRLHGLDAIVPGEFTLMFLHEPDLGLVHYALVTCGPDGQLEVRDPAAAAREAGDEKAALAWERGFPATKEDEGGEKPQKQYKLLDAAAVETMRAASTALVKRRNRIEHFASRFMSDQNSKTESGCKRPKSKDMDDCKAKPVKRLKKVLYRVLENGFEKVEETFIDA